MGIIEDMTGDDQPRSSQRARDRYGRFVKGSSTSSTAKRDLDEGRKSNRATTGLFALMKKRFALSDRQKAFANRALTAARQKTQALHRRFTNRLLHLLGGIEENTDKMRRGRGVMGMLAGIPAMLGKGAQFVFDKLSKRLETFMRVLLALPLIRPLLKGGGGLLRKGAGLAKGLAKRFMATRAGSILGMAGNTAKSLLSAEGIAALRGRLGGFLLSALKSTGIRALTAVLGGPVGIAAQFALGAKMLWDYVLPESWKEKIKYKVAKYWVELINRFSRGAEDLTNWIGNKWDEATGWWRDFHPMDSAFKWGEDTYAKLEDFGRSFLGWVDKLASWWTNFVKPFYDETGNFSLMKGMKHYKEAAAAKGRNLMDTAFGIYDVAVEQMTDRIEAVGNAYDSAKTAVANAPENLARAAENTVKQHEGRKTVRLQAESSLARMDKTKYVMDKTGVRYPDGRYLIDNKWYNSDEAVMKYLGTMADNEYIKRKNSLRVTASSAYDAAKSGVSSALTAESPFKAFLDLFSGDKLRVLYEEAKYENASNVGKGGSVSPESGGAAAPKAGPVDKRSSGVSVMGRPNFAYASRHPNSYPAVTIADTLGVG